MGFVRSFDQIARAAQPTADFYDAEMLTVYFETHVETVARLLPPPLKPSRNPIGAVFVANYPRTSFGITYLESALLLQAEFSGEEGAYCLAMPVTDDMAMIGGREVFGYPKKMAKIGLERHGTAVLGWTERRGIRFLEIRAQLTGAFKDEQFQTLMIQRAAAGRDPVIYNFKYFPAPGRDGFDYHPRLIREVVHVRPTSIDLGDAELVFRPSNDDPWAEVEIVRVLGALYTVGNNTMLPGAVVAEVDPVSFAPYAFMKLDALSFT